MGILSKLFGDDKATVAETSDEDPREMTEEEKQKQQGFREINKSSWYVERKKTVRTNGEQYEVHNIEREENHVELYKLDDLYIRESVCSRYTIGSNTDLVAVIPYSEIDGSLDISHWEPRVFKLDKTVRQKWLANIKTWNHEKDLDCGEIEEVPTPEAPDGLV